MAASPPPTPAEAKLLISDPTSSLCGNFVRTLLRLPVLFYNLISFLFDASGNPIRMLNAGDKIESFAPQSEDEHRKLCNGQALDKTDYAVLYAAIGDDYNTMAGPDGVAQTDPGGNLFRVPNCQARFALTNGSLPIGGAISNGSTGGEEQHTLTESETGADPLHTHIFGRHVDDNNDDFRFAISPGGNTDPSLGSHVVEGAGGSGSGPQSGALSSASGSYLETGAVQSTVTTVTAHNNIPPYYGVYVYIVTGI